jgi:glutamate synthase (NADPH) small chain
MSFKSAKGRGEVGCLRPVMVGSRKKPARSSVDRASAFLSIDRNDTTPLPAAERVRSFREFVSTMSEDQAARQAERCMDCGIPYCHVGCPVHNQIPDWNELVARGDWKRAALDLHLTNNFPEITGRICPAPCEEACTLYLHDAPITIKSIERAIADRAFAEDWVKPEPASTKTGKSVAIVGSGPAGLAAAQQLVRAGHDVVVYERDRYPGGLLRYGIPDFKMDKALVDRRLDQLRAEGVRFECGVTVGTDISAHALRAGTDAMLLACGAGQARDLKVPGIGLNGVFNAMAYLTQQNKRISGEPICAEPILAGGKSVVVIGSGDTACDCIGTAFRQGARSVTQLDIHPLPPLHENKLMSWPFRPVKLRTSSSQAEGALRQFQTGTLELVGTQGQVEAVRCARVDEQRKPIEGSRFELPAQLVLIAIGFAGPDIGSIDAELGLSRDTKGNIGASEADYATCLPGVFAAGDVRRGASLVVWAIREGRRAASALDTYLRREATANLTEAYWLSEQKSEPLHAPVPLNSNDFVFASRKSRTIVKGTGRPPTVPRKNAGAQLQQRRSLMKVKDAMHRGVEWVGPDTPLFELAKLMREFDVGAIPVGENDRLVGMVTDRDIVCNGLANKDFDYKRATAQDVMSPGIHCCREDDDLAKAIRHMEELKIRRLPVINKKKRMVGILSLGDVSEVAPKELLSECVKSLSSHH